MQHTLNTDVAEATGSIVCGIIFNHIDFYIEKVWGDDKRFHDGSYWTYSSKKSLEKSFPYLTAKQIRTAIDKLVASGMLKTGNFNKIPYDRTMWYALGDNGTHICHFCKIHLPTKANESDQEGQPIPNKSSTDKSSTNISHGKSKSLPPVDKDSNEYALAKYLFDGIHTNFPNIHVKESDIDRWARDIEKIHRIDGYDWQTIADVTEFALTDPFWQQNIRSGAKLREKFDTLLIRKEAYAKRNS